MRRQINHFHINVCSLVLSSTAVCIIIGEALPLLFLISYSGNFITIQYSKGNFNVMQKLKAVANDPVSAHDGKTKLLQVTFKVKKASNEYLVAFKNYYLSPTREKYIRAALSGHNISEWKVALRPKLSYLYPSDFDVVHSTECIIEKLQLHPAIKQVSFHSRIQRTLSYFKANSSKFYSKSKTGYLSSNFPMDLADALQTKDLWNIGVTGKGIKVAVFDTGLARKHPHFRNIKERTNWTNDKTLEDSVSHGTFVCGIIASTKECLGIAPDVELHIFRVFTNTQVSYTSWFLDAFNYAMFRKINVLNLSIGGPDFMDKPFVDKVLELSANKVIMISAIGNDGPLYGTLNNPADQSDVIGVGGINADDTVAKFSSRGMTTWELPFGYGRFKPDIVTYGSQVKGSNLDGGCRSLSGTSVASPVVAGAVALLLSGAPNKFDVINPSSVKQIIIEGAIKLQHNNMFEQGYGKLNILKSMELLLSYEPKITLSPPYIDFNDPYMWPYSSQPMYCGSMPSIINITILNGISVRGQISSDPIWHPYIDRHGDLIDVNMSYSPILWPWTGWIATKISINDKGCNFEGEAKGHISIEVQIFQANDHLYKSSINFSINVKIVPKPPKHKRILWDQFHNLQYPPGYIPRDNLHIKSDPLDWRSDHIHTNFRDMYQHLRNLGYYIETLGMPYTCFNASNYGTLLIVDPEEEFFDEEIFKLQDDVFNYGLSIIIFGDWYNSTVMSKMKFYDENTREWWYPDTGGSNIPALNDLMQGFGISLTDTVVEGYFKLGENNMYYASGSTLGEFPKHPGNIVISANLNDQGAEIINNISIPADNKIKRVYPIIGLFQIHQLDKKFISIPRTFAVINPFNDLLDTRNINITNPILNKRVLLQSNLESIVKKRNKKLKVSHMKRTVLSRNKIGRIVVMGDSNCIDSTFTAQYCLWLLNAFLEFTMNSYKSPLLKQWNSISTFLNIEIQTNFPKRVKNSRLYKFSKVIKHDNNLEKKNLQLCADLNM